MGVSDSPPTSPGLLRLLGGEPTDDVWKRFLTRYDPLIEAWNRSARLQPADADDVRAAVVAGLMTALKDFRYDPAQRFRGYLRTCVNNAVRKLFLERDRKPGNFGSACPLESLAAPADSADLAAALDESISEDLRAVHRVVERVRAQVSAETWLAYRGTAIDGRAAADVAHELGKSVAAIYMAKSRVGKLLREEGQEQAGSDTAAV